MQKITDGFNSLISQMTKETAPQETYSFLCKAENFWTDVCAEYRKKVLEADMAENVNFLDDVNTNRLFSYGQCGDSAFWKIRDDVLLIGGKGDMWNFDILDHGMPNPWTASKSCGFSSAVIMPGITSIGSAAFADALIDNIVIPSSVKTVGKYAFFNAKIKTLQLPETLQTVESEIIAADPCRIETLAVSVDIPGLMPTAFYFRSGSPKKLILTGNLPDDLSALIESELFDCIDCEICYPKAWDSNEISFYERLEKAFRNRRDDMDDQLYIDKQLKNIKNNLNPVL